MLGIDDNLGVFDITLTATHQGTTAFKRLNANLIYFVVSWYCSNHSMTCFHATHFVKAPMRSVIVPGRNQPNSVIFRVGLESHCMLFVSAVERKARVTLKIVSRYAIPPAERVLRSLQDSAIVTLDQIASGGAMSWLGDEQSFRVKD